MPCLRRHAPIVTCVAMMTPSGWRAKVWHASPSRPCGRCYYRWCSAIWAATTEALAILHLRVARRAPPMERFLAEAYAWRRAGDPYKALAAYTEALKLAPANKEVRAETATVLKEQGAPHAAAEIAGTVAPYAADEAAAMVRWGTDTRPPDPAHRFDGTDAAIARLQTLLAGLPPAPDEAAMRRRLRLDRVLALRDRVRMQEV